MTTPSSAPLRCAIYTRKSTEEGLQQEFNSLAAQREAGENYIRSQEGSGWEILPDPYDDGGCTGGNLDRPALKRLLADIVAGKVDCVVVYKVDRLSRSLLDFSRLLEIFEQHRVAFVSVTQQFNTAHSMGRLMLNVLLSFAQFEREIISERTRDKIAATRRRGKWSGGLPVLGYDLDPRGGRLIPNPIESAQVRQIFDWYRTERSLTAVLERITAAGWSTKRWMTRAGRVRGGRPFTKAALHKLLTNVTYRGQLKYKTELHRGEQPPLIDPTLWEQVQQLLTARDRSPRTSVAGRPQRALLQGLLRCQSCQCAMTPSQTVRGGNRKYRYYVCGQAQKRGWKTCPAPSLAAAGIEQVVLDQLRQLLQTPALLEETWQQALQLQQQTEQGLRQALRAEQRQRQGLERSLRGVATAPGSDAQLAQLAQLQDQLQGSQLRLRELRQKLASSGSARSCAAATATLREFRPVWDQLTGTEQSRLVRLLIDRVEHDGIAGQIAITYRPAGLQALQPQENQP